MASIGPSVPARRPFFKPAGNLPELIEDVTLTELPIYVYTLQGGWPTFNSVVRLLSSSIAVTSSFSFALIATRMPERPARRVISTMLFIIMWLSIVASILDAVAIARTATECSREKCTLSVPDIVIESGNTCVCNVAGWFYVTLLSDVVMACNALICFILTVRPGLAINIVNHPPPSLITPTGPITPTSPTTPTSPITPASTTTAATFATTPAKSMTQQAAVGRSF